MDTLTFAEEIANEYNDFGILILDDKRGSKVAAIAETKHGNSVAITVEILRRWLLGKGRMPVTLADIDNMSARYRTKCSCR